MMTIPSPLARWELQKSPEIQLGQWNIMDYMSEKFMWNPKIDRFVDDFVLFQGDSFRFHLVVFGRVHSKRSLLGTRCS